MPHPAPHEWLETTIGEIARIRRGASPRPIDSPLWFADEGPGWVRITDVTRSNGRLRSTEQYVSRKGAMRSVAVYPGQVIMSICATIGEPVVLEMEACIHDGFVVFDRYEKNAFSRFLYHFLKFSTEKFRSAGQTGTQANLNTGIVRETKLFLPPLREQYRIAEILDTIDEAIQKTEALIEKLKGMKQGLLHDLLTRGLDERGKLRDPKTHPEKFKDSPLGRVPIEWDLVTIDDIAIHVGSGATPRGGNEVYKTSGVMFVRSQNVTFNGLTVEDIVYISSKMHEHMRRSAIYPYDVLLNITGASIGRCCYFPVGLGEANVNQHVCGIRLPSPSRDDAVYLSSVLSSWIGQHQVDIFNAGGNREGLNYEQLRSFLIPWPDREERFMIARALSSHDTKINIEKAFVDKLRLLKKGLMHDLLTGKVRVSVPMEERRC